jgi:predicted DNA-binding transcriptional regulator AlpA
MTASLQEDAMQHSHGKRWLTIREFADELGVSVSTAYKWSAAGAWSGRFPRTPSRPTAASASAGDWLDAWITSHETVG